MIPWTPKAKLNAIMFALWVIALGVSVMIPIEWYANYVFNNKVETKDTWSQFLAPDHRVSYQAVVTASTNGIFSAANPVNIEVKILNANITDFMHEYQTVKFTDGKKFTLGSSMPLSQSPDGGWIAKGKVTLYEADRIWMLLSPEEPTGKTLALNPDEIAYITSQEHILQLGPESDTLALQFNSFAVKVAFIFGTFSILLLAPIFEAILIPEKKGEPHTKQSNSEKKG